MKTFAHIAITLHPIFWVGVAWLLSCPPAILGAFLASIASMIFNMIYVMGI